ncbi:hypothetical protein J3Q64DRAFT_1730152 [Phycomyces blakesleeanus]|uniref:Uncharacterized protein n=2 Tax=Phycomyces blakesleeanus TaxID=4837 RepID=A0A162Q0L1_PHYB8|nr:hypothetical protein PHYBLDRAFT_166048 [Phycomyces blakesleeanus NRRL 1555(-)]OAD76076.1 hypothetical protein PHYBLDRAFT_166048 [Phycomyces blakesleeanus NRRL 1555(-)]|eukprot:XP_018294116.1 hypothetical protein PHYBLDRAFT_166048 [Phycomyces blakesleeanus NRRL 1555(-)]
MPFNEKNSTPEHKDVPPHYSRQDRPIHNTGYRRSSMATPVQANPSRRYSTHHRPSASTTSSSFHTAVSRQPSTVEIFLKKFLDVFIFATAIAFTAYNYWTGTLALQPLKDAPQSPRAQPTLSSRQSERTKSSQFDDACQQRTREWTEDVTRKQYQHQRRHSSKSTLVEPKPILVKKKYSKASSSSSSETKRKSWSSERYAGHHDEIYNTTDESAIQAMNATKKTDERMTKISDGLELLIKEAQEALASKVEFYDTDIDDIAM